MNILGELLGGQNGQVLKQLSNQFGLGEQETRNAVGSLLPSISNGMKRNLSDQNSMESMLKALQKGNHSRYLDDPSVLSQQASTDDGNGILGHIFGSKDTSRNVASQASKATGISSGILKKMLPIVAGLAMGSLGKSASSSGILSSLTGGGSASKQSASGLMSFLDMDNDGSVADDLLKLATKFF